jgi:hypothetical protein
MSQIDFANKKTRSQKIFTKIELNINQIGSYNAVSLNIKAESINLDVLQNGDKNTFESNKHVNDFKGSSGRTKQYYKDVSSYHANGTDVNMEFIQKGIIKVFRIGVNSISKDMKVKKKATALQL